MYRYICVQPPLLDHTINLIGKKSIIYYAIITGSGYNKERAQSQRRNEESDEESAFIYCKTYLCYGFKVSQALTYI